MAPLGANPPARNERLFRRTPRWIQILCAVPLLVFAGMIFYGVVVYLRIHQYYGRNLGEKLTDLAGFGFEAMVGCALVGLAINLMRGTSRRADGGLFSPLSLRIWAVVFALLPLPLLFANWQVALHFHWFFAWSWGAAAACLVLAARRASTRSPADLATPIE